jgi:hypothetical protein
LGHVFVRGLIKVRKVLAEGKRILGNKVGEKIILVLGYFSPDIIDHDGLVRVMRQDIGKMRESLFVLSLPKKKSSRCPPALVIGRKDPDSLFHGFLRGL